MLAKLVVLGVMVVASWSGVAGAQQCAGGAARKEAQAGKDWAYTFCDEPVAGAENGGPPAKIEVRQRAIRVTLIRPRTQFVTEMLKSVEAL